MNKPKFHITMRCTITDPAERQQRLAMLARTYLFRADGETESGRVSEAQPNSADELPAKASSKDIIAQNGHA